MQIFLQNWKEHVMMIYIVISSYNLYMIGKTLSTNLPQRTELDFK